MNDTYTERATAHSSVSLPAAIHFVKEKEHVKKWLVRWRIMRATSNDEYLKQWMIGC
jgi:hypothetical protein